MHTEKECVQFYPRVRSIFDIFMPEYHRNALRMLSLRSRMHFGNVSRSVWIESSCFSGEFYIQTWWNVKVRPQIEKWAHTFSPCERWRPSCTMHTAHIFSFQMKPSSYGQAMDTQYTTQDTACACYFVLDQWRSVFYNFVSSSRYVACE